MAHNFTRFFGNVDNNFRTVVAEGEVVVVEHRLSATLPNGRSYLNACCFVYEVRDGKVWRIREYMDTRGGWAQVFGESEPVQLLEFVFGELTRDFRSGASLDRAPEKTCTVSEVVE
jgi:uncharacterized protein